MSSVIHEDTEKLTFFMTLGFLDKKKAHSVRFEQNVPSFLAFFLLLLV